MGGGDRSRIIGGDRALGPCDIPGIRLGCTWGEERRELLPEVLPEVLPDRSDSRTAGEGVLRLQFDEAGPDGARSSRLSGVLDRGRWLLRAPGEDTLRGRGDLARMLGRSRSKGDLDLLLICLCEYPEAEITCRLCAGHTFRLSESLLSPSYHLFWVKTVWAGFLLCLSVVISHASCLLGDYVLVCKEIFVEEIDLCRLGGSCRWEVYLKIEKGLLSEVNVF